jgi:negative regulator of flagellin synthesis FlgM
MKVNNHKDSVELSQLARSKRSEKANAAKNKETGDAGAPAGSVPAAGVEISSEAKALSQANQIARSENVDQAKIDRIKAMINQGTYKPDIGKVADKVVNETLLQELT